MTISSLGSEPTQIKLKMVGEMDRHWVIAVAPHDQEGADKLYALLGRYDLREFILSDSIRALYTAMELDILKSAAWHNGHYVGDANDVQHLITAVDAVYEQLTLSEQLELPLGEN